MMDDTKESTEITKSTENKGDVSMIHFDETF